MSINADWKLVPQKSTDNKLLNCECSRLPDIFYLDEGPKGFMESLHEEDVQNWMRLFSCLKCGTLWAIDVWDKYYDPVVNRVKNHDGWASDQKIDERKNLLLRSRGGTTDKICIWSGCKGKRVKGVVYCIDHLWETGARR
jgi:hypothetical protein